MRGWKWAALAIGLILVLSFRGFGVPLVAPAAVAVALIIASRWVVRQMRFTPFCVQVWPTPILLMERGFATEEQVSVWYAANGRIPGLGPAGSGVGLTVLKPRLCYRNDSRTFSTTICCVADVDQLLPSGSDLKRQQFDAIRPYVSLEWKPEGLSLGVVARGDHEQSRDPETAGTEVALLPWSELGVWQWHGDVGERRRNELRLRHGWKTHDLVPHPFVALRHKYFDVRWHFI
jgi:hypothetical protein